jgi:hypothetical protein
MSNKFFHGAAFPSHSSNDTNLRQEEVSTCANIFCNICRCATTYFVTDLHGSSTDLRCASFEFQCFDAKNWLRYTKTDILLTEDVCEGYFPSAKRHYLSLDDRSMEHSRHAQACQLKYFQ